MEATMATTETTLYTVTIRETKHRGWTKRARVRATDERDARFRAVRKLFGQRAGLEIDSGLGPEYGQVTEPMGPNARNCITGRVRVVAEPVAG